MARTIALTMPVIDTGRAYVARLNDQFRRRRAQNAVYRRTVAELAVMSDRDLLDIGVSRDEIHDIAAKSAYGA